MNAVVRLSGYGAVLALAFGIAWGVGTAVGSPLPPPTSPDEHLTGHEHPAGAEPVVRPVTPTEGLVTTAEGYTLVPDASATRPGRPGELAFTVTGADGAPVTAFDTRYGEPMQVVVARRDSAGFQRLHPVPDAGGVWRAPLTLPAAGVYRLYADIAPTGGPALVLGADLFVPGDFRPVAFGPSRVAQVDGYQVRLDGDLVPGGTSQVFATVSRDGRAVTDLEPDRGTFGQLVALHSSDLRYLHVHPDAPTPAPTDRAGPSIAFTAEVPSAGTYRLFLEFRHGGAVHTAEFTVETRSGP